MPVELGAGVSPRVPPETNRPNSGLPTASDPKDHPVRWKPSGFSVGTLSGLFVAMSIPTRLPLTKEGMLAMILPGAGLGALAGTATEAVLRRIGSDRRS